MERLNKTHLGRKLSISRVTIDKYLSMSGAPKGDKNGEFDVAEVAKFIGDNAVKAGDQGNLKSLREKKLGLECIRLAHEIKISQGEYIKKDQVESDIYAIFSEIHHALHSLFEHELPPKYRGKGQIEIQQINARALDDFEIRFKAGLTKIIERST